MDNTTTAPEIEDEYAWVFFGRSAEYYLGLWQLRQRGKYIHFNVAAFFFGFTWLAYRRMYRPLVLVFLLAYAEASIEVVLLGEERGQATTIVVGLIQASLLGLFGNALYLWDAERKIRKILRKNLPKDETLTRLRRAGGTSLWFLAVLLLLAGLVVWLAKSMGSQ